MEERLEKNKNAEDLSGIREELEEIWEELEVLKEPPVFAGVEPGSSGGEIPHEDLMPFEVQLRRARDLGDTIAALRIKQEAANAGIVLL